METILVLLLLSWLFAKSKKSAPKKDRRRSVTAEAFAQKAAQMKQTIADKRAESSAPSAEPLVEGNSRMAFTRDAHGCVSEREEYMGSMNADTSEGEDACDPSLGHERMRDADPESVYAGEIGREPPLDLSAKGLYQGIVMSEILARPNRRSLRRF